VKVTVKKNKVAAPFRVAEFDIMYNEGISKVGDVLDIAVETGIVEKRGSFYAYGDTRLGQGRENAKQFLRDNPNIALMTENQIREAKGLTTYQGSTADKQPEPEVAL
jgi:recombination protein RecA